MNNASSVAEKKDGGPSAHKAAKYTAIFRPIGQAVSFAASIVLVMALSEHDYGIYNLMYSVISLMGVVASFGLANTLQRFIPEYYSRGEYGTALTVYRVASGIRLISNIFLIGVIFVLWDFIAPLLKIEQYKSYFLFFSLIILIHLQNNLLQTVLNSYFLQKYTQLFILVFSLIRLLGYSAVIFLHLDLWTVLVTDLCAYIFLQAGLQLIYSRNIPIGAYNLAAVAGGERKRLTRYAFFCNFNDAGSSILDTNFDNFLIAMYLDPVSVGAYSFCQRLAKNIERMLPITYFIDVVRPAFYRIDEAITDEAVAVYFKLMMKINLTFMAPIFCFIATTSQEMINVIFGGKFKEYASVLTFVLFFSVLNSMGGPIGLVAHRREKVNIILYSKLFAVYNILADIVFIKFFGIIGVVFATGTAVLGKNLFVWYFVRKEASIKGITCWIVKLLIYCIAVSTVLVFLKKLLGNELLVFVSSMVITVVFAFVLIRYYMLNEKEKDLVFGKAKKNRILRLIF